MGIEPYLMAVNTLLRTGESTEHSFRPALLTLLRELGAGTTSINEATGTAHGRPDITTYRGDIPIGNIETKDVAIQLNPVEETEQFRRYLNGFSNLIVTNYVEFRWYVDHREEPILSASVGTVIQNRVVPKWEDARAVETLLRAYLRYETRQTRTAADLAERLALQARVIRDNVHGILDRHDDDEVIRQELHAFRTVLIPDLSENDFADMYAQTIVYGLFAARCTNPDEPDFRRITAPQLLPISNPFLRNVFASLAGTNLDDRVMRQVDDVCTLLRTTDINAVLADFARQASPDDPVIHFYETFLRSYDADTRRDRGVFYTPLPVVSFIVRSIDQILIREAAFDVPAGLATSELINANGTAVHKLQILDPATGTGTFLLRIIDLIAEKFSAQPALWELYVRDHLLSRLYGFELLIAPYTIAHLKVGLALHRSGFDFTRNERLQIFLTNSLEDTSRVVSRLPFETFLTQEASEANEIKQGRPIMVVLGNPPYSVRSSNMGPHARALVEKYKILDGRPMREGGTLALQRVIENDYIKFIAFAQEQIVRNQEGVVGFITANSYLDSPVLAGFRESLLRSFDRIHIVDLHGYALTSRDGDENVFAQIGEAVAIILLVRLAHDRAREAQVFYSSIRGSRSKKRAWLDANDCFTVASERAFPVSPDYRFRPENAATRTKYRTDFVSLTEIFGITGGAIVTARDAFVVGFTQAEVLRRIEEFRDHPGTLQEATEAVGAHWRGDWRSMASDARTWLRRTPDVARFIQPIAYRPFDIRFVFYEDHFLDTPAHRTMDHLLGDDNIALLFGRSVRYGVPDQFFATRHIAEAKCAEASRQCHAAPLYLVDGNLLDERSRNLRAAFVNRVRIAWGGEFGDGEIFAYVYAMLFSNLYRATYADQICQNFARIPVDLDPGLARALSIHGANLVRLHTRPESAAINTQFNGARGGTTVSALRENDRWAQDDDGRLRLYLSEDAWLSGVPKAVQEYRIGGYPVIQKFLNSRVGRAVGFNEVIYLQQIVAALSESVVVTGQIDALFTDSGFLV